MSEPINKRLKHAWNAFMNRDPTIIPTVDGYFTSGYSSTSKPDRKRLRSSNERSIITSIYNRIALDVTSISIQHVRLDQNERYIETIHSELNNCLTLDPNLDQTGRSFMQDVVMSLFDEGCVAIVPIDTTLNPLITGSYDISSMRVGQIMQWYPSSVRVKVYNEKIGRYEEMTVPKKIAAIIENPFYAVMNEPNSTLQRLIRKLNLLDAIDEQSGSGKLDIIIQVPYVLKTQARQNQAVKRKQDIEDQLAGSKYGIAYTDASEKVTQLNRPVENNLMEQIEYLMSMLYSQLSITTTILDGTADEKTMLNYFNRTVEPVLSASVDEMKRKFLTKTARSQLQSIIFFRDPFKLVPVNELAEIGDKFTRNEIFSPNDMRAVVGYKPSKDPKADELRNRNINEKTPESGENQSSEPLNSEKPDPESQSDLKHYGVKGMKWGVHKSPHLEGDVKSRKVEKSDLEGVTKLLNGLSDQDKKFLALDQKIISD